MNVVSPNYPMRPYDFLTFTEYEDQPNPGVKLGIMLDKTAGGLIVKGVIPESIAARNGLGKGDILTQIGTQVLTEPFNFLGQPPMNLGTVPSLLQSCLKKRGDNGRFAPDPGALLLIQPG